MFPTSLTKCCKTGNCDRWLEREQEFRLREGRKGKGMGRKSHCCFCLGVRGGGKSERNPSTIGSNARQGKPFYFLLLLQLPESGSQVVQFIFIHTVKGIGNVCLLLAISQIPHPPKRRRQTSNKKLTSPTQLTMMEVIIQPHEWTGWGRLLMWKDHHSSPYFQIHRPRNLPMTVIIQMTETPMWET